MSLFHLKLPLELREQIYTYAVHASLVLDEIPGLPAFVLDEPALTRVSRAWRAESLPIYNAVHRYHFVAPVRRAAASGGGGDVFYNPLIDQERMSGLPHPARLARMRHIRVAFRLDRFVRGQSVQWRFDVDLAPCRRGSVDNGNGGGGKLVPSLRFVDMEARYVYDPSEWRERAGALERHLREVVERMAREEDGCNGFTRESIRRLLCVDQR